MNYLTLENIKKSYGDKVLFDGLSMSINEGQKIALVARNGTGKTTLLRVIAGQEGSEGEKASVLFKKDLRIEYLTQEPEFNPDHTVIDAIFKLQDLITYIFKEIAVVGNNQQGEAWMAKIVFQPFYHLHIEVIGGFI